MKKTTIYIMILLLAAALAACGATTDTGPSLVEPDASDVESVAEPTTAVAETGMGRMGMGGGSMRDRHHAPIPEEYANLSNPIPADEASQERGAEIYIERCASCHGDGGVGDGPDGVGLDPAPTNIAHTSQMMGDSYLFYRISEGGAFEPFNSSMIAWKGVLDEDARWDVINYMQALGSGAVTPGQHMGGAAFDPAVEAAKQAEMLAAGVEQGVITEEEGAIFAEAHEAVDARMIDLRGQGAGGSMDEMLGEILVELVEAGELTQEQADTFLSVHDRLGDAGLMQ